MALNGTLNTTSYEGMYYTFTWNATQNISNNTSTIKWTVKSSGSFKGWIAERTVNVKINDLTEWSKTDRVERRISETVASGSFTVNHSADGTGSFKAYVEAALHGPSVNVKSANTTFTLNQIARATIPTISASTVEMGSALTISCPRSSDLFKHTLTYTFGDASGTIGTDVATTRTWNVPMSLANQVPNATSGSGTITCKTYNGSDLIGTKSVSFKATVPSSIVPNITSVTLSDPLGYANTYSGYVQNRSKLKVQVASSGVYNSTISNVLVVAEGVHTNQNPYVSNALTSVGTNKVVSVTVTDSRGRKSSTTRTFDVLAYSTPSITKLNASRCNQDGSSNDEGAYVKITYGGKITNVNSNDVNSKSFVLKYKKQSDASWTSLANVTDSYTVDSSIIAEADTESEYDISFAVKDSLSQTQEKSTQLSTAFTLMDFNASGKGIALGKVSTDDEFEVNLLTVFDKDVFFDKDAFFGNIRAFYKSGDTITTRIYTAGFVTNSGTNVRFSYPLSKPIPSNINVTLSDDSAGFIFIQDGKYTNGSSASTRVMPTSSTILNDENQLSINLVFSDTTNIVNNDVIAIDFIGTFILS